MTMRTLCAALAATTLAAGAAVAGNDRLPTDHPTRTAAVVPTAATRATGPLAVATDLLDQLDAGDFTAAAARLDRTMAAALPAATLQEMWHSLPAGLGEAIGRGEPSVKTVDGRQVVAVALRYEKGDLMARLVIDADNRIAGFAIQPAPPTQAAAPAADAAFTEQPFQIGRGERALPGTLAIPKVSAPADGYPAVVLVHGSGPHDRDVTMGPNRPFLDIARSLAGNGIAVLRYDKRTLVRPQDFAAGDYTVDDETTDDAVQAVIALSTTPGIDSRRVYVLGHSQGAMLAPRIAHHAVEAGESVAGLVMLAAPARPVLDLLTEQHRYLFAADGEVSAAEQALLDALYAKIVRVRSGAAIPSSETPLNAPAAYLRDLDAVDAVAEALQIEIPMLLLHGGRDYQVTDADWRLWHRALDERSNATLKDYPALNHLGIAGTGPVTPADYQQPGHVDAGLLADIVDWIHDTHRRK